SHRNGGEVTSQTGGRRFAAGRPQTGNRPRPDSPCQRSTAPVGRSAWHLVPDTGGPRPLVAKQDKAQTVLPRRPDAEQLVDGDIVDAENHAASDAGGRGGKVRCLGHGTNLKIEY